MSSMKLLNFLTWMSGVVDMYGSFTELLVNSSLYEIDIRICH